MEQIPITDLVPPKFQMLKKYSEVRAKMEQNLADSERVARYTIHETGHLLYQLRTGVSTWSEVIFTGPTIYYDNEQIGHLYAGVRSSRISLLDKTLLYTDSLLEQLAIVGVAGNVFELNSYDEDEDSASAFDGDYHTFLNHCHEARRRNEIPFTGYSMWPTARTNVLLEVQAKVFPEVEIQLAKQAVRLKCFGLK
jgi:hypothetical protein